MDRIHDFLRQGIDEKATFAESLASMHAIVRYGEAFLQDQNKVESKPTSSFNNRVKF
jgi:hypothetical protein